MLESTSKYHWQFPPTRNRSNLYTSAFAIILPLQALVLYNDGNLVKVGLIASIVGLGIISGQFVGGALSEPLGKTKIQCIVVFALGGICEYSRFNTVRNNKLI